MENQFNNINLLKLLYKWRTHLLIVFILSVVVSIIFSGKTFIAPKFKSEAIVYPQFLNPYSKESESEQMLQIMQSKDITDSVIKKFDLLKHYKFEDTLLDYDYLLIEYNSNVKIKKTDLESIDIKVMDTDPRIACDMVKAILYYYNKKAESLLKEKYKDEMNYMKMAMDRELVYLDSISTISGDKAINFSDSHGMLAKTAYNLSLSNSKLIPRSKNVFQRLRDNKMFLPSQLSLIESTIYMNLRSDYEEAFRNYNMPMSYLSVITPPFVSLHKTYPVRSIIIILSTISAVLFAIGIIIVIENFKKFHSGLKS